MRAFRATLEEVVEAELLLHVVDASSPHAPEHTSHVLATLREIGADTTPQILVLNKADQIPGAPDTAALARRILEDPEHQPAGAVAISARTGEGLRRVVAQDRSGVVDRSRVAVRVSHTDHRWRGGPSIINPRRSPRRAIWVIRARSKAEVPESIRRRLTQYLAKRARERGNGPETSAFEFVGPPCWDIIGSIG